MKKKLAIISTHPIQYYSPLFKELSGRGALVIKVFFTCGEQAAVNKYDHGFGKVINWDIPLLEGYQYEFLKNISTDPGPHKFKGIINPDIIERIKAYEPDVILVFGWAFEAHLKVLRYFYKRIPVFFRGDSTLLDEQPGIKTIARALFLRWLYHYVDKALYVGKSNYAYYLKFGLKPQQLVWAPHAIDNSRFMLHHEKSINASHEMRKQLNIEEDVFVFLFAGKFETKKDPFVLLNAFLGADFANKAHLVLVGNGVLEAELKSKADGNQTIHFMNFQNQSVMPAVYRMANVFILPSAGPGETWGLAVNEAMACERAVIVSDKCGCAADLVVNGENGFVFTSGDVASLRARMLELFQQPSLVKLMGKNSLEKIQQYAYPQICAVIEREVNKV